MKHVDFTEEIGATIVTKMQEYKEKPSVCAAVTRTIFDDDYRSQLKDEWVAQADACYAPTVTRVTKEGHPDHFGIVYLRRDDKLARIYLDCLLNPDGAFKGIFPYLWHKTSDEVMYDCGFVFHNVEDPECNKGLLWTFIQATRRLYEHHYSQARNFEDILKVTSDRDVALALLFSVQPNGYGTWRPAIYLHGSPLGIAPSRFIRGFLQKKVFKVGDEHKTAGSHNCFQKTDIDAMTEGYNASLSNWAAAYEAIRDQAA